MMAAQAGSRRLGQPLWNQIKQVKESAIACGALQSFETDTRIVKDSNVKFIVRYTRALAHKPTGGVKRNNPFDPPEPELFVTHLSDTHSLIFNKFNVLDNHLLMVTRQFESQENHLTENDLAAAWTMAKELECLTFFNRGSGSGASQPHKHIQAVPLPLFQHDEEEVPRVPIEPKVLEGGKTFVPGNESLFTMAGIRWKHICSVFSDNADVTEVNTVYRKQLEHLEAGDTCYNWMMTDKWMMTVMRENEHFEAPLDPSVEKRAIKQEKAEGREEKESKQEKKERAEGLVVLSPNTLGFAGTLLAKNDIELEFIQHVGPMAILNALAYPLALP